MNVQFRLALQLIAGTLLACQMSLVARAELIQLDLLEPSDGLVTRDTATQLDWLDLTATLNLRVRDIRRNVGGWQALGFRHATIQEVQSLFLHSDYGNVTLNTGQNPFTPANVPGAQRLLQLLGTTQPGPSGNGFDVLGLGHAGVGEPGQGLLYFADFGHNTAGTLGFFFAPDGIAPIDHRHPTVGNFLVRRTQVPEPSSILMAAAGVAALLTVRRPG